MRRRPGTPTWLFSTRPAVPVYCLPATAWSAALAADGGIRDGAQVAELTGLLTLAGWPPGMR
ncbi:hypothetical protein M2302_003330 [Micromonospora sp. A200]|uniref:hypothetical protein n=1 Tax=Micromonospora sp. A200 TaxID=2940568 RepID=UPI0024759FCE|nr:hypothetical protein [Micromonospora sp. A200]MDH6463145.1 hypothetical protein [Micromonospora sp. A200]